MLRQMFGCLNCTDLARGPAKSHLALANAQSEATFECSNLARKIPKFKPYRLFKVRRPQLTAGFNRTPARTYAVRPGYFFSQNRKLRISFSAFLAHF